MYRVYSFNDVSASFNHPSVGSFSAVGEGIGEINIEYSAERTKHDVGADGYVMISKIKDRTGKVTINALQVSGLNDYLQRWWRYIESASSSEYADMVITIRGINGGDNIVLTGVAPTKPADRPYKAQGETVAWELMVADVDITA